MRTVTVALVGFVAGVYAATTWKALQLALVERQATATAPAGPLDEEAARADALLRSMGVKVGAG